jgi:hypothetical protein
MPAGGLTADTFRATLARRFADAERKGRWLLVVNSDDLCCEVCGPPASESADAIGLCCDAMYAVQRSGDKTLSDPMVGKGTSLTIRYRLPRA